MAEIGGSTNMLHFLPGSFDPPHQFLRSHSSLGLLSNCRSFEAFKQIHSQIIKFGLHNTHFGLSKLMEFCAVRPYGNLDYAMSIFDCVDDPCLIMYNTIIRGHSLSSFPSLALNYYVEVLLSGYRPNSHTFSFLLKSCTKLPASSHAGKQVHGHIVKFGLEYDAYVRASLINMYAQHGKMTDARTVLDNSPLKDVVSITALITGYLNRCSVDKARELFDTVPVKDVVSWNAMISGCAQIGRYDEALEFFKGMRKAGVSPNESTLVSSLSACAHVGDVETGNWIRSWIEEHDQSSNLRLANALVDMYAKCGDLNTARTLFDGIRDKNIVSWNVMIGGYTHSRMYKDSLETFHQMQLNNVVPNDVTLLHIIPVCAHLGALDLGKWMHVYVNKHFECFPNDALWTCLIDMYAKCGDIEASKQVFNTLQSKSLASWNAMMSGLAIHGNGEAAIELFHQMANEGLQPDEITFVGVLSACCNAGMVGTGKKILYDMMQKYKIAPKLPHYGCIICLLARAGMFEEAVDMVRKMEMEPDGAIWGSILSACRIHRNLELAEYAAGKLFELEPYNTGAYILLSNIYAGAGNWDKVASLRTCLNEQGLEKVPGSTSIEVDGVVHEFLVSDRTHLKSDKIYEMLSEVDRLLKLEGHEPDTSEVYYDLNEELKEGILCEHSEKLAISFGLISTKPGRTLRIVKNLRVCGNCHAATKLISKIFNREIIARDRSRFHHFKDGICSCMDYW